MTPLIVLIGAAVALVAGTATLRSLGPGYRIGRLLATARKVPVSDAIAIADGRAPRRYVAIEGRIDSDDAFEDAHQRPLVLRRTRIEVRTGARWRRVEDSVEAVPFEVNEGLEGIGVDTAALGDGLVVIPRISEGRVADLGDRVPPGFAADAPARATIDQVSSIEHATVIGWPSLGESGRRVMTAGGGRPLVLSVLEPDEAMRVLAHGERLRPRVAAVLLVVGLALAALGLAWAGAQAAGFAGTPVAFAASPSDPASPSGATPSDPGSSGPVPSGLAGDTRSSGEGPGLVGTPGLAVAGVLLVGLVAAGGTLIYVRLTGGSRRR
ncbi:MAG: hypothetical protein HY263_01770 [Chloroflexi bacterium]|nr:hypothetical protein [Chloroflexota bacterium]